jgi:hypothetical protein
MNDQTRWDQDPPHDAGLARLLRTGNADAPYLAVDWEQLCRTVMRRARTSAAPDWWDFVAQWGRVAVAASIAAMTLSGFLLWQVISVSPETELAAAVPESIAVARAASAYPDESTFASLVRTEHHDEFTTWGIR